MMRDEGAQGSRRQGCCQVAWPLGPYEGIVPLGPYALTSASMHLALTTWRARRGMRLWPFAVLALAACAPSISVTRLASTPSVARAPDSPIPFYQSVRPRCAYDELALVVVRPRAFWTSPDELVNRLRERARSLGGDAVIAVKSVRTVEGASLDGAGSVELDHRPTLSGTVVRYRDVECRE